MKAKKTKATKVKKVKKEISEVLYLYIDDERELFSGSIKDVANKILSLEQRLKEENQDVISNPKKYIRFEMKTSMSWDNDLQVRFYGIRKETQEEFSIRLSKELINEKKQEERLKNLKKVQEKRDLTTFLRLQKKFGKKM